MVKISKLKPQTKQRYNVDRLDYYMLRSPTDYKQKRIYCKICEYETLPIPVKRFRCSGCGKDYS